MKVSEIYGIISGMYSSTVVDKFVIDCHVVVKEVELTVSLLLDIHLWHPVVGKVQRNVTA